MQAAVLRFGSILSALVLMGGWTPAAPPRSSSESCPDLRPVINPVDPQYPPAIAGVDGWDYHKTPDRDEDLDGDGIVDHLHVIAHAAVDSGGEGLWDDGQPWQVYVETGCVTTHVFSRDGCSSAFSTCGSQRTTRS